MAGCKDWLTFPRCDNFNVCPGCYDAIFVSTGFQHNLVLAPMRPTEKKIACDLGSSHWYRIAWLMTKKYQLPDLRLLKGIADAAARHQPCGGDRRASRVWHSINGPYGQKPVADFKVCSTCVRFVEVLFPNLVSVFQPVDSPGESPKAVCALHFAPDRKKFLEYFDILESASDRALSTGSTPDIGRLVDKMQALEHLGKCSRDTIVDGKEWHTMRSLPGFLVCQQCFDEVVYPELQADRAIARNFLRLPQLLPYGSCQLYSPRMREVFLKACQRNDLDYLESKVLERCGIEAEIHAKLLKFEKAKPSEVDKEKVERLVREWKRWE